MNSDFLICQVMYMNGAVIGTIKNIIEIVLLETLKVQLQETTVLFEAVR